MSGAARAFLVLNAGSSSLKFGHTPPMISSPCAAAVSRRSGSVQPSR